MCFLHEDLPSTCGLDVVFAIDSSTSITSYKFAAAKQMVMDMVQVRVLDVFFLCNA